MKVVALVSGGKDSCYAIMRCIDFGHEIVALANLLPMDDTVAELDSHMYQTVGHEVVEAYAQCMGVPLFRRRIHGKLRSSELRYTRTDGDEVEDLEVLIRSVKEQVPSVDAVSSGAIASDYQRLRVENVCSRLGLVSLAYLWKRGQAELLQEMVERGISAILVKVAAMGLDPYKHLGQDISVMRPILSRLNEKYGCNVCGEGGEYETITLDCPLFKYARIVMDGFSIELHSPGTIAPVGVLLPKFHLEPKNEINIANEGVVHWVGTSHCSSSTISHPFFVTVSCWQKSSHSPAAGALLSELLDTAKSNLRREGLGWSNVLYIHLYLQDMNDFNNVNAVYSRHISELDCPRGVPSRSTIAVSGPMCVEVLAARNDTKAVLHVQSISCWAPSCIGPYSQATMHSGVLLMAGQLGLDPPKMVLVAGGASEQMLQACSNSEAVAASFETSLACSVGILVYCCSSLSQGEVREAEERLHSFVKAGVKKPLTLFIRVTGLPKGAKVEIEPSILAVKLHQNAVSTTADDSCYYYKVPGRLCRIFTTLHTLPLDKSLGQCLDQVNHALKDSELSWEDVQVFRIYFVADRLSFAGLRIALDSVVPRPFLIPVSAVGCGSAMSSILAMDVFAEKMC